MQRPAVPTTMKAVVTTGNGGFGLLGVRERVQLLGGSVHIETGPGQGFSLAVEIPD